jgi:Holliday junction resolvasome RuvABC endonuclease subunit
MGIDPSLNCLGFFVFESDTMEVIDYGYIPNKTDDERDKILKIYNLLSKVFDAYDIKGVGIEEEFFSSNALTIKRLSHVHGAILLLLAQRNIPHVYYSVMTAKSVTLDGIKNKKEDGTKKTGDEMKQEVAKKIFEIFGVNSFTKQYTLDVTDAASIGYTYLKMDGKPVEKKPKKKAKPKVEKVKSDSKAEKSKTEKKSKKSIK